MPGPGRDLIGEEEISMAVDVLRSGYLYRYGPDDDPHFKAYVRQLEDRVAEWTGVRYALATSSGTASLWRDGGTGLALRWPEMMLTGSSP